MFTEENSEEIPGKIPAPSLRFWLLASRSMNIDVCDACGCSMDEKLATTISGAAMRGDPTPVVIDLSSATAAATVIARRAAAKAEDATKAPGAAKSNPHSIQITSSGSERRHLGTGDVEITRVVMTCDERSWEFRQLAIGNRSQEPFLPADTTRWADDPPITIAQFRADAPAGQLYERVQYAMAVVLVVDYTGDDPEAKFECKAYGTYHPPLERVKSTICVTCAQPLLRALKHCDASKRAETALAVGKQVLPPSDGSALAAVFQNLGRGATASPV